MSKSQGYILSRLVAYLHRSVNKNHENTSLEIDEHLRRIFREDWPNIAVLV